MIPQLSVDKIVMSGNRKKNLRYCFIAIFCLKFLLALLLIYQATILKFNKGLLHRLQTTCSIFNRNRKPPCRKPE